MGGGSSVDVYMQFTIDDMGSWRWDCITALLDFCGILSGSIGVCGEETLH
jgi:hypothetical protein